MKILRLSTLSLSIAMAVITLGFANPAFAGKKCDEDDTHKSCKDGGGNGGDDPVTYEVALQGAFVVNSMSAALEGQDDRLRPDIDAVMKYEESNAQATWDMVFSMPQAEGGQCDLFGSTPGAVLSFTALSKNKELHVKGWRVARPGGVYVEFGADQLWADPGSEAGEVLVNVSLQLSGNCEYSGGTEPCDPFLPASGETSVIPLTAFWIHAKALKGSPQFDGCHTSQENLDVGTLMITAITP